MFLLHFLYSFAAKLQVLVELQKWQRLSNSSAAQAGRTLELKIRIFSVHSLMANDGKQHVLQTLDPEALAAQAS